MDESKRLFRFASDGVLTKPKPIQKDRNAVSEPNLTAKRHPLLDETDENIPCTYHEYLFAAETLENIVNEGTFVGTIQSRYKWHGKNQIGREMSDRVLKLVYGTMKCKNILTRSTLSGQFIGENPVSGI